MTSATLVPAPIAVALDAPDGATAARWAAAVAPHVQVLKVGLELFCATGPQVVEQVRAGREVFLDLKLHDIPNTVAKAVRALAPLTPAILTIHASGGRAMMEDAKASAPPGTKVIAVTMLTSLDASDLTATGIVGDAHAHVVRLADLARAAGLDGIVCSGAEVGAAKAVWPKGFFVVPGVRLADDAAGDQKRVVTPRAAIDAGASILVVGRPITRAADPDLAARALAATL